MVESKDKKAPDTESLILKAAEDEFFKRGYDGARTTAIAEAAGVTHAMLHYYFRTKEKLFEKIVSKNIESLKAIMLAAMGDEKLPLFERVRQGVEGHFDFIASNPLFPRFIFNEVYSHPKRYETIKNNLLGVAKPLLAELQTQIDTFAHRGECRAVDARMLLLDIVSVNIFPFIAEAVVGPLLGNLFEDKAGFLARRKAENVETILRKLKP